MAKAKQITDGENTITINPKSKNTTYEYSGTGEYIFKLDANFSNGGKEISGYEERYNTFAVRKDNNLVLTTLFTKENGSTKKVTTTVKNFFADPNANYKVDYKSFSRYDRYFDITTASWLPTKIQPNSVEGTGGLYGAEGSTNDISYLLGTNGDDEMEFKGLLGNYVYNEKGDDEYLSRHSNNSDYIYDMAGNDDYKVDNYGIEVGGLLYVSDYKGNDEYEAAGTSSRLMSHDYAGNDEYELSFGAKFLVNDYKGNDEYSVNQNGEANSPYINAIVDRKGNDAYYFQKAQIRVTDSAGKDYYRINNLTSVDITEEKGNDTYEITNSTDMQYGALSIGDAKGNDTYNLTSVKYNEEIYNYEPLASINDDNGNDKYNLTDVEKFLTYDVNGNDKYTIKDSMALNMYDSTGNDKYDMLVESDSDKMSDIYIYDYHGKDIYNVIGRNSSSAYADNITISDSDAKSKDRYTVKYTTNLNITDDGGNDSYTISEMFASGNITIQDNGGKKDKLIFSDLTKDDLVFMTDIRKNGTFYDNGLIVVNKNNYSFVYLPDFFTQDDSGNYNGFGDGRIETIKAGKTTFKDVNKEDVYGFFNEIKSEVSGWLTEENRGGVYSVLTGNDENAKDALIAYFSGNAG